MRILLTGRLYSLQDISAASADDIKACHVSFTDIYYYFSLDIVILVGCICKIDVICCLDLIWRCILQEHTMQGHVVLDPHVITPLNSSYSFVYK